MNRRWMRNWRHERNIEEGSSVTCGLKPQDFCLETSYSKYLQQTEIISIELFLKQLGWLLHIPDEIHDYTIMSPGHQAVSPCAFL